MVQEIAQKIIATAKEKKAQDIYFIPKEKSYELHMRVGDERCLVDSYEFDVLAAVISHFKFVATVLVRTNTLNITFSLQVIQTRRHCSKSYHQFFGNLTWRCLRELPNHIDRVHFFDGDVFESTTS